MKLNRTAVQENSIETRKTLAFDAVGNGEVEIYCYGDIWDSFWFWDPANPPPGYVTQDAIKEALGQAGGKPILFRIHSSGGDMMAASAIRALLMSYQGRVTCQVDGLCASAATYIATAGAKVTMQDSAFFMIHDPWTITIGNVDDHRVTISMLKELKKGIVEAYMAKSTLEQSQIEKMMSDETWMSAQTALENGFVDEIISQPASARAAVMAKDSLPVMNHALKGYREVPEAVKEMMNVTEEPATSVPEKAADTEPDEGEIEREGAVQALREKTQKLKEMRV
jgi:ATP-dependent Clp protease protease subunit